MGDFNTTFWPSERINTTRSKREIEVAIKIKEIFEDLVIIDCWGQHDDTMTWKHGNKMSRIDRIQWTRNLGQTLTHNVGVDWTITSSDHAAVIVELKPQRIKHNRSVITRIDTTFMSNAVLRTNFLKEVDEKMSHLSETSLNPHGRLEYLKMVIRSAAIEIATNYKKKVDIELKSLQKDIAFWQTTFENSRLEEIRTVAGEHLDILMAKRDSHLNERGKFLSDRSKMKWYQEGEKSSKYFLNLNKYKGNKDEMTELIINGVVCKDREIINRQVENFYTNLYEKGNKSESASSTKLVEKFLANIGEISNEKIDKVDMNITANELFETLKSCVDSAPGPDGIPYSLIKLTWNHFGQLLVDSWEFSEKIGTLPPSHNASYLRLLPKEGKDTNELKNWRPITLSNCDFKLITKTLSWRLADAVTGVISPNQTAYMKDRQISDNLNVMLYTLEQSKDEKSMLVSLDAEKAFDSLEHWYIKKVLSRLGLIKFIKIFDLLYKDQGVDIILNGNNAGKYKIRNGVKQGDALSCILFILGIEPVLNNINADHTIKSVNINGNNIPKVLAYADDIACLIKPDQVSLQKIFDHYSALTEVSGLKLNADKTEIISNGNDRSYNVTYMANQVLVRTSEKIKVNGIVLSYSVEMARKLNIEKMIESVRAQLNSWTKRNLSLLGKIQIFKTFGLSQILYTLAILQTVKSEDRALTDVIYKFIWNKNMDAKKAPDRIKRSIMLGKVRNLGFGMIDYKEVVNGIRQRNVLRLLNQDNTPLTDIIKSSITTSVINIKVLLPIRDNIDSAIKLIRLHLVKYLKDVKSHPDKSLLEILNHEYVGNLVLTKYRKQRIIRIHRNDRLGEVMTMSNRERIIAKLDCHVIRYVDELTQNVSQFNIDLQAKNKYKCLPIKDKILRWPKISSRTLRESCVNSAVIKPKMLNVTEQKCLSTLGISLAKLTNSKLKSILLRCLHGDVYSRDRMFRFGMVEDDLCPRCNLKETVSHMLFECNYSKRIWAETSKLTGIKYRTINEILGIDLKHDKVTLTIHAELLRRLMSIERPQMEPKSVLKMVVASLNALERGVTKYQIGLFLKYMETGYT